MNVAEAILSAWNSSVVDQYARKKAQSKSPEMFDTEGNARWITIGGEPGPDGKKHGGHPVKIDSEGKMLTGKFAGQKLDDAFGKKLVASAPGESRGTPIDQEELRKAAKLNRPAGDVADEIRKIGQMYEQKLKAMRAKDAFATHGPEYDSAREEMMELVQRSGDSEEFSEDDRRMIKSAFAAHWPEADANAEEEEEDLETEEEEVDDFPEPPLGYGYAHGHRVQFTGKTEMIHGGEFSQFKYLEGPQKGLFGVMPSPKQSAEDAAKHKAAEAEMQAAFRRLHELSKAEQSEVPEGMDPVWYRKGLKAGKLGFKKDPKLTPGTLPHKSYAAGVAAAQQKTDEPKPGIIPGSTKVKNEDAKPGDQLGLFGEGDKAKPKAWKPTLPDSAGKQQSLFDTKGDPDQLLMFDDGVTPQDRLLQPEADSKYDDRLKDLKERRDPDGISEEPIDQALRDSEASDSKPSPSSLFDDKIDAGDSPREAAKAAQKALDADYAFARKSAIPNQGEDLKGSARHTRNAWRSLEEAEKNGTAEALVTREQLLKNEPHNLAIHVERDPEATMFLHHSMKSFPPKPGGTAKDRSQYLDAYRSFKNKVEELAKSGGDIKDLSKKLSSHLSSEIKKLRGVPGDTAMDQIKATDRFNATANSLVSLTNSLAQTYKRSSPARKVIEAIQAIKESNGHDNEAAMHEAVHSFLEGKTLSSLSGQSKGGSKREYFNPAKLYVGIAQRTGGRDVSKHTRDPNTAAKHLVDSFGIRGVQWGNSLSDDERKHHASKAVEALTDLADVVGLHPKDIALDGKLGLAIGARGRAGAVAHYEPDSQVINLTRKNGVGSLAHEWAHAFDHMLGGFKNFESDSADQTHKVTSPDGSYSHDANEDFAEMRSRSGWKSEPHPKAPIRKALKALATAQGDYRSRLIKELTDRVKDGSIARHGKTGYAYWKSEVEIFARTFERYVQHKIESDGRKSTYLAGIETKGHKAGGLWPTDEEVKQMAPAFDKLFEAYREQKHGSPERVKYSRREAFNTFVPLLVDQYANPNWMDQSRQPKGNSKGGQFAGSKHFTDDGAKAHRRWFESNPVVTLSGDEFAKIPGDTTPLSKKVGKWFQEVHNGKAVNPEIGEVILNERSAKDSIAHGIGREKSAAFAAVPQIISEGKILKHAKDWVDHAGMTGYVIGAPIQMAKRKYAAIAIVRKDFNQARFYLHEVQLIEKLQEDAFKTAATDKSVEPHGASSGVVQSILREIFEANTDPQKGSPQIPANAKHIAPETGNPSPMSIDKIYKEINKEGGRYSAECHKDLYAAVASAIYIDRYGLPTEAQREAGNYKKHHIRLHGLEISIETKKGEHRRPEWPAMPADYGYIKRTLGRDGDHVDVFVGPSPSSELVVIIDQVDQSGRFDEHKCMLGFRSSEQAVATYRKAFTKGWKVGRTTTMTIEQFKNWLKSGDQTKPVEIQVSKYQFAESFDDLMLASSSLVDRYDWKESQHPREPSGTPIGGQFKSFRRDIPKRSAVGDNHALHHSKIRDPWRSKVNDWQQRMTKALEPLGAAESDDHEDQIWHGLDKSSIRDLLAEMNQMNREAIASGHSLQDHVNASALLPDQLIRRLGGGSKFFDQAKLGNKLNAPASTPNDKPSELSPDQAHVKAFKMADRAERKAMLANPEMAAAIQKAMGLAPSKVKSEPSAIPGFEPANTDPNVGDTVHSAHRPSHVIMPNLQRHIDSPHDPYGDRDQQAEPEPSPAFDDGLTPQMRARANRAIKEELGPGAEQHHVDEFRSILLDAWRMQTQIVDERNDALRQILGSFGAGIGGMVTSMRRGKDTDQIKAFDEMAEMAAREYPHLVAHMRGQSGTGSSEEGLAEAIREGIRPRPKLTDEEVFKQAWEMAGHTFIDDVDLARANPPSSEWDHIPFSAKLDLAHQVMRYWQKESFLLQAVAS